MRRPAALLPVLPVLSLALLLAAGARPLAAQPLPATLAETALHIAESADVTRRPDELVATLRAEARASSPGAAQEAVNRSIAAAVARAQAVSGVRVSTSGYWTGRVEDSRNWQAAQSLTLRGSEAPALLELAGTLQGQGLAMVSLHWTLTREAGRAAREEAARLALQALRQRVESVAAQLGLAVAGLREVRIDAPDRQPHPVPMMAARGSASFAAPPPVAVAEDVTVSATVEAVAVLRPR